MRMEIPGLQLFSGRREPHLLACNKSCNFLKHVYSLPPTHHTRDKTFFMARERKTFPITRDSHLPNMEDNLWKSSNKGLMTSISAVKDSSLWIMTAKLSTFHSIVVTILQILEMILPMLWAASNAGILSKYGFAMTCTSIVSLPKNAFLFQSRSCEGN